MKGTTMTNERAALVEELENLFAWSWGKDLKTGRQVLAELGDDPAPYHRRETMFANKAVEIFDRLLATRTAPGLDELLDSINCFQYTVMDDDNGYFADIVCGRGRDMLGYDKCQGTGPTRMDAIRNAADHQQAIHAERCAGRRGA